MSFSNYRSRWGPEWRTKKHFGNYELEVGGHMLKFIVPDRRAEIQSHGKSREKYAIIYDKIKDLVKDEKDIEKDNEGLPIVNHIQYALLILAAFEELNMKWLVADQIWFKNPHDIIKTPYIAVKPKKAIGKGDSFNTLKKKTLEKKPSPESSVESLEILNLDDLSIASSNSSKSSSDGEPMVTLARWSVYKEEDKKEKYREFLRDYNSGEIDTSDKSYFINKKENPTEWKKLFKKHFPDFRKDQIEYFEKYGPVISDVSYRMNDKTGKYELDEDDMTFEKYFEGYDPENLLKEPKKYFEEVYYPNHYDKLEEPKNGFIPPIEGLPESKPKVTGKTLTVAEWDDGTDKSYDDDDRFSWLKTPNNDIWKMKFMSPSSHEYGEKCACGYTGYEPGFWRNEDKKGLVWKDSDGKLYMKKDYFHPKFMGRTCDPDDNVSSNRLNDVGFDEQVARTLEIKFIGDSPKETSSLPAPPSASSAPPSALPSASASASSSMPHSITHVMNYSTKNNRPFYTSVINGENSFKLPVDSIILAKSRKNNKYYIQNTKTNDNKYVDESSLTSKLKGSIRKGGKKTKKNSSQKHKKTRKSRH
jgi:hypothetical protein